MAREKSKPPHLRAKPAPGWGGLLWGILSHSGLDHAPATGSMAPSWKPASTDHSPAVALVGKMTF